MTQAARVPALIDATIRLARIKRPSHPKFVNSADEELGPELSRNLLDIKNRATSHAELVLRAALKPRGRGSSKATPVAEQLSERLEEAVRGLNGLLITIPTVLREKWLVPDGIGMVDGVADREIKVNVRQGFTRAAIVNAFGRVIASTEDPALKREISRTLVSFVVDHVVKKAPENQADIRLPLSFAHDAAHVLVSAAKNLEGHPQQEEALEHVGFILRKLEGVNH